MLLDKDLSWPRLRALCDPRRGRTRLGFSRAGGSGHAARRHGVVQRGVCPIALSYFGFFFRNKGSEMGNLEKREIPGE